MKKKKSKTRPQLIKMLDTEFSRYIRNRDNLNGFFTCPTCGKTLSIDQSQAGHYISRVVKEVRWDDRNVHAQCARCNLWLHGAPTMYRIWIGENYGEETAQELDSALLRHRRGKFKKFTPDELRIAIDRYKNINNN
jgi:transcription elongation factor Elf1